MSKTEKKRKTEDRVIQRL